MTFTREEGKKRRRKEFKLSIQTTMLGIKEMPQRHKSKRLKQQALKKQDIAPQWRSSKGIQHRNVSPMHFHNIPIRHAHMVGIAGSRSRKTKLMIEMKESRKKNQDRLPSFEPAREIAQAAIRKGDAERESQSTKWFSPARLCSPPRCRSGVDWRVGFHPSHTLPAGIAFW
jgi:hypothetical protein